MTNLSKVILRACRVNKKVVRRDMYSKRVLGRLINGIAPSQFEESYSAWLFKKTIKRQRFIDTETYFFHHTEKVDIHA